MAATTPRPLRPFHLAVQVRDLAEARAFYRDVLGCAEGRSTDRWIDFDLYGHQFVCHLNPGLGREGLVPAGHLGEVDGQAVPIPHFGVVLDIDEWQALAAALRARRVRFLVEPQIRFQGRPGEQGTLFICDPSGNALEFKGLREPDELFAGAEAPAAQIRPAMPVAGIDHVVLRTSDLDAMVAFYTGALGCYVERRLPPEYGMVQLRAGQSLIDLVSVDGIVGKRSGEEIPAARNMDHFCLRVAPFDEAAIREQLTRAGVEHGETAQRYGARGYGSSIYVRDPEGNTVELKAPPASKNPEGNTVELKAPPAGGPAGR
jgi:extradiol dioxygenase family protein